MKLRFHRKLYEFPLQSQFLQISKNLFTNFFGTSHISKTFESVKYSIDYKRNL